MAVNPSCQFNIAQLGQPDNCLPQNRTIALQIITRQAGKGRTSPIAAQAQSRHYCPESRARPLRVFGIIQNIGMGNIQLARSRILLISAFGNGQGNYPNIWLGHRFYQRMIICLNWQIIQHCPGHFHCLTAFGVQLNQGGQAILF